MTYNVNIHIKPVSTNTGNGKWRYASSMLKGSLLPQGCLEISFEYLNYTLTSQGYASVMQIRFVWLLVMHNYPTSGTSAICTKLIDRSD